MKPNDLRGAGLRALFGNDEFHARHLGPSSSQEAAMLDTLGVASRSELIAQTVPASILREAALALPEAASEVSALAELRQIAEANQVWRSYIGAGYHGTITPEPIRRNLLENPGWYTAYTPYQAEVAQGRLEAMLNFQQMVIDLTGLPVANASLLDEATAAAEAMAVCRRASRHAAQAYFVDRATHPQVIAVLATRAKWMGIELVVGDAQTDLDAGAVFGAHFQTPDTEGRLRDFSAQIAALHASGGKACIGCDPLALVLVKSAGAMDADLAIGSAQRFGVPLGYGGPHAAFMAARAELVRTLPGRIIGVSKDAAGNPAMRMSLQTREQHIRRDKATSNICTAQALLANIASFYAVYHGPQGLARIALRVNALARLLVALVAPRLAPVHGEFFDTLAFDLGAASTDVLERATALRINLRQLGNGRVGVSLDETTRLGDVADLAYVLGGARLAPEALAASADAVDVEPASISPALRRAEALLTHPVFNRYHSETDFVRYLKKLENRDISLVHSMIALGSCTMKLNAASEMAPVTWPEFANIHPFVPPEQAAGYARMLEQLGSWLAEITGFAAVSFQPNSGAQGEYAGLLAIRSYLAARGQGARDVCLIPASAHGTNPASAQMMGMRIVVVACDRNGNIDMADLRAKIGEHRDALAALMVTYPSTHGVFEATIRELCTLVHEAGGQVYMDGANLNALAGLARPGDIGADVCHMNLHKTFCIPHGGGGPGMGPIAVAAHLAPHLPRDPFRAAEPAGAGSVAAQRFEQRADHDDLVDVPAHDGRRRRAQGDRGRDPERQLHRGQARALFPGALRGRQRPRRTRVHPRHARAESEVRRDRRGRREAADRLRLSRTDPVVPGRGHADDRTHRERVQAGARPILRRDDRDSRRTAAHRRRQFRSHRQSAQERTSHRGRDRGPVGPRLLARVRRLPARLAARREVLAFRQARGQRRRRPQPGVHLPAGVRLPGMTTRHE